MGNVLLLLSLLYLFSNLLRMVITHIIAIKKNELALSRQECVKKLQITITKISALYKWSDSNIYTTDIAINIPERINIEITYVDISETLSPTTNNKEPTAILKFFSLYVKVFPTNEHFDDSFSF